MTEYLLNDLAAVSGPIKAAATLPPACYTDSSVARLEWNAVFGMSWIGLGRGDKWKLPGDYDALELAGIPIIIVRDTSGTLRAFANSCRHRGSLMLEGSGNIKTISCPFHRWTYGLGGELRGAPDMPDDTVFKRSDYGLTSFRISERDGFAFLCFDDQADDIDIWLGDFSELHVPWSLGTLATTRRLEFEVECNWKTFLEVFNEYYHLPYVHPTTVASIYNRPDSPESVSGRYASQFSTTDGTGGLLEDSQQHALPSIKSLKNQDRNGTRYTWLFPNMTFAASTEAIWVYESTPLGASRCRVVMSVCFPDYTIQQKDFEKKAKVYYERMDAALAEDIPALIRQQKGLTSPYARQGRFCAELEPNVASFAMWYADRLKQAL